MNSSSKIAIVKTVVLLAISLLSISCSKEEPVQILEKQEFVQHFNASIAGRLVSVQNSVSKDRGKLKGDWTGIGYGDGSFKEFYGVEVELPGTITNSENAKLRFQVKEVARGLFPISGLNSFFNDYKDSYIVLMSTTEAADKMVFYTANPKKAPFMVEISKYEFAEGSAIPTVGGTLNGTLYNEQDITDSIVIKNGNFEVRF